MNRSPEDVTPAMRSWYITSNTSSLGRGGEGRRGEKEGWGGGKGREGEGRGGEGRGGEGRGGEGRGGEGRGGEGEGRGGEGRKEGEGSRGVVGIPHVLVVNQMLSQSF